MTVGYNKKKLQLWKITGDLRGIAILGVILNHAVCFSILLYSLWNGNGETSEIFSLNWRCCMPFWVFIQEVTRFAVPLFLFLSGIHMAKFNKSWRVVWSMSKKLLLPLLFWSSFGWFYRFAVYEQTLPLKDLLIFTVKGEMQMGYFYIPLIIQYYILSLWLVGWVKKYPMASIFGSLGIQIIWTAVNYMAIFSRTGKMSLSFFMPELPDVLFPSFIFFFTFGVWAGQNMDAFRSLLGKMEGKLVFLSAVFAVFMVYEHGFIYRLLTYGTDAVASANIFGAMSPWKVTTNIFSFLAILLVISVRHSKGGKLPVLNKLGTISFTIYILHGPIYTLLSDIQYKMPAKAITSYVFLLLFISAALGVPYLLEKLIGKKQAILSNIIGLS